MILNSLLKYLIKNESISLEELYNLVGDIEDLIKRDVSPLNAESKKGSDSYENHLLFKRQRKIRYILKLTKAMERLGLLEKDESKEKVWKVVLDKTYYNKYNRIKELCKEDFVVLNIEVSDLDFDKADVLKISALKIENLEVKDELNIFINNNKLYDEKLLNLVEIKQKQLDGGIEINKALLLLKKFVENNVVLVYHYKFDYKIMQKFGIEFIDVLDLLDIFNVVFPEKKNRTINMLAKDLEITEEREIEYLLFKIYLKLLQG